MKIIFYYYNMFWEKSYSELSDDINTLSEKWEISNVSHAFLDKKLNEFKDSDNDFEDYEAKIISQQIELHKDLQDIKDDFNSKSENLTSSVRKDVSSFIQELSNEIISESEIVQLEWVLQLKKYSKLKDLLDSSIWLPWLISIVQDRLSESWNFSDFLQDFTLFCLENNMNFTFVDNYIDIDLWSLQEILYNFLKQNKDKAYPETLDFTIRDWEIRINIKQEQDRIKQRYSIELKKARIIDYFTGVIDDENLGYLYQDYWIKSNDLVSQLKLYDLLVSQWELDYNTIDVLYKNWEINWSLHLAVSEKLPNFNLLKYLQNYPLSEYLQDFILKYARDELWLDNNTITDNVLLENAHDFIITFIEIESSGRNISNDISSAEWYYQFLTLDGEFNDKGQRLNSSYQTWLTRIKRLLSETHFEEKFWEQYNLDFDQQDPKELSAENQTLLFLWHTIESWKKIWWKNVDEFMELVLKEWNTWALKKIYYVLHHTKPDDNTKKVFERIKNQNFYWNTEIIAKNHY